MAAPPIYREPLDGTEMVRVLKDGRFYMAPLAAVAAVITAPLLARLTALEAASAAHAAWLAVLDARPEEVAHFTASTRFPTLAVGASFTLIFTGFSPAKVGDFLKAGEQVEVWPTGSVPPGVTFGRPSVTADNTVALPCSAGLAIAASSTAVPFAFAALR